MNPITFQHGSRLWAARRITSEDHKHLIWIVAPAQKGAPFPSREEYREARRFFNQLHSSKPKPRLVTSAFQMLKP